MSDVVASEGKSVVPPPVEKSGASFLTFGGVIAAFGAASCCALPLLFATFGLSTAWLTNVALIAAPHRELLLVISEIALFGGAALLWRQQRAATACSSEGACVPPILRTVNFVGLLVGSGLLWAGYTYV